MKAWSAYAGAGLLLVVVGVVLAGLASPADARGIRIAVLLAYVLQLIAFAVLVRVRKQPTLFLAGWLGGIAVRFIVVGVSAWWLKRTALLPPVSTMMSMVLAVFVLLLLEPVFLRKVVRRHDAESLAYATGAGEGERRLRH